MLYYLLIHLHKKIKVFSSKASKCFYLQIKHMSEELKYLNVIIIFHDKPSTFLSELIT